MVIKVKRHADIGLPKQAHPGEWCDLECAEDVRMKAREYKIINLGVSIELPKGFEAIIAPRSSTFKNYGVLQANSLGIIDNKYCGENDVWGFVAYATRDTHIEKGTRICQFRIQPQMQWMDIVEVQEMGAPDRGGFGSTGI